MPEIPLSYIELFVRAAASSSRPHYLLHTRAGIINREQVAYLRAAGIPVIGGIREGLAAIDPTGALHRARWSRLTEESRRGRSLSLVDVDQQGIPAEVLSRPASAAVARLLGHRNCSPPASPGMRPIEA